MPDSSQERRLAAILVADAVSYSTLMNADEIGTHERYSFDVSEVMLPLFAKHNGRLIKKTGDGVLAIFPSVVNAVDCAGQLQGCLPIPEDGKLIGRPKLTYRIGIHLGDILIEADDVYGNEVNIATRLESLAEPGGFALSGAAYWNVKGRSLIDFEEVGFLRLKNIAEPIQVYQAVMQPLPKPDRDQGTGSSENGNAGSRSRRGAPQHIWSESRSHQPEIIVLPFQNLSTDSAQEYLCDGLTCDLTVDLSRFSNIFVIDANTAFSYKGQHPTHERLRREFAVEYMVEGSVQRFGRQLRVSAQLIETRTGRHLWAERYDLTDDNLFAVQDDVRRKIVMALISKLSDAELSRAKRKQAGNINSYDAFLKGLHEIRTFLGTSETLETLEAAEKAFARSIDLDPDSGRPHGWLAYCAVLKWKHGWSGMDSLPQAEELAKKAVALDPGDHDTHWALASCYSNLGKFDHALEQYERALEINGNDADLHAEMADLLSYLGKHREAIGQIRFAMRINPHFPEWYRWTLGWGYYFIQEYREAVAELGKLLSPSEDALLILAASHARLAAAGEEVATNRRRSHELVEAFRRRRPRWTIKDQEAVTHYRNPDDTAHWLEGLHLAGL